MAITAEFLVMATNTCLLVVFGFDRVDADKVTAVALGHVVALKGIGSQFCICTTASMAIATE